MQTRVINAEHVLLAIVTHKMRKNNPTLARFAAMSNGAFTTRDCNYRDRYSQHHTRRSTPPLLCAMLPSVRERLIKRVRLTHGLAEVKKTWGIGYKAMLAEVASRELKP